jgi:hypothetical protein
MEVPTAVLRIGRAMLAADAAEPRIIADADRLEWSNELLAKALRGHRAGHLRFAKAGLDGLVTLHRDDLALLRSMQVMALMLADASADDERAARWCDLSDHLEDVTSLLGVLLASETEARRAAA